MKILIYGQENRNNDNFAKMASKLKSYYFEDEVIINTAKRDTMTSEFPEVLESASPDMVLIVSETENGITELMDEFGPINTGLKDIYHRGVGLYQDTRIVVFAEPVADDMDSYCRQAVDALTGLIG